LCARGALRKIRRVFFAAIIFGKGDKFRTLNLPLARQFETGIVELYILFRRFSN
jgi:hypothetical protein